MFLGTARAPLVCQPARSSNRTAWAPRLTVRANLVEVELHRFRIGEGQRQRGAGAAGRADRAEQVGALVALVGWLTRPRPAPGPLPHEAVLLADAGLVLT